MSIRFGNPILLILGITLALSAGLPAVLSSGQTPSDSVQLLADGFESAGLDADTWASHPGVAVGSECGAAEGSQAAVFGGDAARRVLGSHAVDADAQTTVDFAYTTGYTSGPHADTCPTIDDATQRPRVQISTDGGHTWTTLTRLPASDDGYTYTRLVLPANQGTEHTRVRWVQHRHDGAGADVWAVDHVNVTTVTDGEDPVLNTSTTDLGGFGAAGYAFSRAVTVNNTGETLTEHPVEVVFDSQALIEAGKLQADCDDLRFANDINSSLLDHEVTGGCGNSTTTAWVEVPRIPPGNTTLQMYYGDVYGGQDAPVDPVNESATADPQPTTSLGPERDHTATTDADGDDVPDELEATLCEPSDARGIIEGASLGGCDSETDLDILDLERAFTVRAPQWTNIGPDADGDDLPATVRIEWVHVTFHRSDDHGPRVRNGGVTTHVIDPADGNKSRPSIGTVCTPIPRLTAVALGPDADGDGVADFLRTAGGTVCVDEDRPHIGDIGGVARLQDWDLDPDDGDASVPAGSLPNVTDIPRVVSWSADADADGVPDAGTMDQTTATWDVLRTEVNLDPSREVTSWDPDDGDHHEPLHLEADSDGDEVPDSSERFACEAQDPRTDLDGFCFDEGTDYHPPHRYPSEFIPSAHLPVPDLLG